MKVKLMDIAGNVLREMTFEGAPEHDAPPDVVVLASNGEELPGTSKTFLLTRRDTADGSHEYTAANYVVVIA